MLKTTNRICKTRGGSDATILAEDARYLYGIYSSGGASPEWLPMRWELDGSMWPPAVKKYSSKLDLIL